MKGKILRGVLLWCLLMGAVSCTKDNVGNVSPQYSELLSALQSTGAFYEFAENPDTAMVNMRDKTRSGGLRAEILILMVKKTDLKPLFKTRNIKLNFLFRKTVTCHL